jgi:hypothetical protein
MPNCRFGKHPPKVDYRTLMFKSYLTAAIAPPPPALSVLDTIYKNLNQNDPTKLFPMDGNDTLGDCTIAALAHAITVYRGKIGKLKVMPTNTIVKLYRHLTGGADTGLNELDVLNYWRAHKVATDEILAYVRIDPRNHTHVQQAIQLFGGVYIGFQVQQNAIADFNVRKAWTPGTLLNEGHAVYAVGYDQNNVTVLTWGNTQQGTWAWWDECVDEAYAILPPEANDPKFAPGFNIAQLQADMNDVAN